MTVRLAINSIKARFCGENRFLTLALEDKNGTNK